MCGQHETNNHALAVRISLSALLLDCLSLFYQRAILRADFREPIRSCFHDVLNVFDLSLCILLNRSRQTATRAVAEDAHGFAFLKMGNVGGFIMHDLVLDGGDLILRMVFGLESGSVFMLKQALDEQAM